MRYVEECGHKVDEKMTMTYHDELDVILQDLINNFSEMDWFLYSLERKEIDMISRKVEQALVNLEFLSERYQHGGKDLTPFKNNVGT